MWYDFDNDELKIKNVYSKHTIDDFWRWWASDQNNVMEVRIKGFEKIKNIAKKIGLPYSASGVYIKEAWHLKKIISELREQETVWFGIQPRKKNYNKWGNKSFGGSDANINTINFIFIDIDRVVKKGFAGKEDLKNSDELAEMILERFGEEGWNKSHMKICSGNGIQLLIKLDYPIKMPEAHFNNTTKTYIYDTEYDTIRNLLSKGIGNRILRFANKHKERLGVEVDKSCFTIGRVGALPFTKNFKYDGYRWRGIIEIKKGTNTGLTDYILSKKEDVKTYNKKNMFKTSILNIDDRLRPGRLKENKLINFMLNNDFPEGYINNTLWMQIKCLLRDSNIDIYSEEVKTIHDELKTRHKRIFSLNLPEAHFVFDKNIINRYCIDHMMPPLYEMWPGRRKKYDSKFNLKDWNIKNIKEEGIILEQDTHIRDDLEECKKKLNPGDWNNKIVIESFIRGCINKYGEEKTSFYIRHLFDRYLNWE